MEPDSAYRMFANSFAFIRMPLFTFLSGFVYAFRPVSKGTIAVFVTKKFRRLFLPFVTAATIFFLGHWLVGDGTPPTRLVEMWRVYLFSYEHLWFLQALLLIFLLTVLLESVGALANLGRQLAVLVVSLVLSSYIPIQSIAFFSISEAVYLLPYFLLGLGANRYRQFFFSAVIVGLTTVAFLASFGLQLYDLYWGTRSLQDKQGILAVVVGFSATLLAIRRLPSQRALATIGTSSFVIYLYHPLFAAAIRMVGGYLGDLPVSVLFWSGLAMGIAGPIVMEILARRPTLTRLAVLGQK